MRWSKKICHTGKKYTVETRLSKWNCFCSSLSFSCDGIFLSAFISSSVLHLHSPPSCCCPSLSRGRFMKWTRRAETKQHFLQAPPSILSAIWQRGTLWGHQYTALHQLTCGGIKGVSQATSFIWRGHNFLQFRLTLWGDYNLIILQLSNLPLYTWGNTTVYIYWEVFMVTEHVTYMIWLHTACPA